MSSKKEDWARRVSERIDLEMEKARNDREQQRVAALNEAHLSNLESRDFAKNCERRIANAVLEADLEKTLRKEERLIAEDLERNQ